MREMLCEYGCERKAKYQFRNGRWCCSESWNSCPGMKRKNSKSLKGYKHTEEAKRKMSKSRKGREVWNKGLTKETDERVRKQSSKGRKATEKTKQKQRGAHLGKKQSKEHIRKRVESRKKNGKPWQSKESRKSISETRIGKYAGKAASMFGKHHTEESKKLMREAHLGMKKPWVSERTGKNHPFYGKKHTEETIEKISGPKNHNWNPDRKQVFAPYTEKFYDKKFRKQILLEQKSICPICNKKLKDKKELHHIDSNKQNDYKENLVFLCPGCHKRTRYNKNYWKKKLEKK